MVSYGGAPPRHFVVSEDVISPVEVGDDDAANLVNDDDDGMVFVYTEGAEIPTDVVRMRVDPSVEIIPPQACMGRKKLIEVIFPEGKLHEIGYEAFAYCTALNGVLCLPSNLWILHNRAFECCTSLTEVIFRGDGILPISDVSFGGCTALLEQARKKTGSDTIRIFLKELPEPTEEESRTMPYDANTTRELIMHGYDIDRNLILKRLFDTFCINSGVTLRSLRLFYKGKRVFMSDLKNKTPIQLGMLNSEKICFFVESAKVPIDSVSVRPEHMQQRVKTTKNKKGVRRGPSKVKKERIKNYEPVAPVEDYKRSHSMILTRVHEEMQPRLNYIRRKLNAHDLKREPPKLKSKCEKKGTREGPNGQLLPGDGIGGKAGKSFFVVQVGAVENLHKTTKPTSSFASSSRQGQSCVHMLDLHGCTRDEAILRLNKSLNVWVDTAMRGYDPFVITVSIICGCGSQVLMETVQEWIKSTSQVRNAPKNHIF